MAQRYRSAGARLLSTPQAFWWWTRYRYGPDPTTWSPGARSSDRDRIVAAGL